MAFFNETAVVLCGDALIDQDITAALQEHKANQALASVVATKIACDEVSSYGIVVSEPSGRIRSLQEKPEPNEALSNLASTGIYIFGPDILKLVPSNKVFDIGADLSRCVLFEYTRIAADMEFTEMIVSRHYCMNRHGDTLYRGDESTQLHWGDARA